MPAKLPAAGPENGKNDRKSFLKATIIITSELAAGIISNRYSAQLPVSAILTLCGIPIGLSIIWLYAREQEKGTLKRLYGQHPISYSVIAAIAIVFIWNTSAILVSRYREAYRSNNQISITATASPHPLATRQGATPAAPAPQTNPQPDTRKSSGRTLQTVPTAIHRAAHKAKASPSPAQPPTTTPALSPAAQPGNGGPNCPNNSGFCTGTNNGTQQQFFGAPHPAPTAHFSVKLLPTGTQPNDPESTLEGMDVGSPGAELTIRTDGDFQSPTFRIICDGGCFPTLATLYTRQGPSLSGVGIHYRTAPDPSDPKGFFIKFTVPSGTLEQGQTIVLRLRTGGLTDPVKVASVTSFTE